MIQRNFDCRMSPKSWGLVANFCLPTIYNVIILYYKIYPPPKKKSLLGISAFCKKKLHSIGWSHSTLVLYVVRGQTVRDDALCFCCALLHLDELNSDLTKFYINYRCLSCQKQRLVTYATDIWRTFHYCPNSRQR